jgi:uncharacterized ParB-like nuclease family protein
VFKPGISFFKKAIERNCLLIEDAKLNKRTQRFPKKLNLYEKNLLKRSHLTNLAETEIMKQLIFFTCMVILTAMLSCDLTEVTSASGDFPSWVSSKVQELSANSGESCEYVWVTVYEVAGKRYYNIDFAFSSCSNCNLYDRNGNRVSSAVLANPNETKVIGTSPGCVKPK